jgi:peroxiredoxin
VLKPGDKLPDIALVTPDGLTGSLAELRGEAMALIFLRHLG